MHPVIQMTVAVMMVVIAARMWPPLLYWLAGIVALLMVIKGIRRFIGWIAISKGKLSGLAYSVALCLCWLVVAAGLDFLHPQKISAVSIVLCFICACIAIGILLSVADWCRRYLHRR